MRSPRTAAAAWPRARAVGGEHKRAWGQVAEVKKHPPSLLRLPLRTARRRSASSLSPRRPGHAKGEGGAFTHPQGPAARSRSREQGAPLFAHVPRSLAPPATSRRRSPLLRFVPADPVAHVARNAQEACSLTPKNEPFAREAVNAALSCLRTCLVLSLLHLPLRAARRSSASSPPSYSFQQRGRRRSCVRSPHGRAACPRSSDCPIILRSPPFALSLDELPLRAARRSPASSGTCQPGCWAGCLRGGNQGPGGRARENILRLAKMSCSEDCE